MYVDNSDLIEEFSKQFTRELQKEIDQRVIKDMLKAYEDQKTDKLAGDNLKGLLDL